jgi:PAS domain S-box-containing protein
LELLEENWPKNKMIEKQNNPKLKGHFLQSAALLNMLEDLEEEKEKLKESEELLSSAEKIAKFGGWSWNVLTNQVKWTNGIYTLFGVKPGEFKITFEAYLGFVHPKDKARAKKDILGALKTGGFTHEITIIRKDGVQRKNRVKGETIYNENQKPIRMIGTSLDITAEQEKEEKFEDLFNLSPDMMLIAKPDGDIIKINNTWEKVLGYKKDEIIKMGWTKLVHPDDIKKTKETVKRQLKGNSVVSFINRYKHKDGSYITLEWQATYVKNGLVYAIARDISKREIPKASDKAIEKLFSKYKDMPSREEIEEVFLGKKHTV